MWSKFKVSQPTAYNWVFVCSFDFGYASNLTPSRAPTCLPHITPLFFLYFFSKKKENEKVQISKAFGKPI